MLQFSTAIARLLSILFMLSNAPPTMAGSKPTADGDATQQPDHGPIVTAQAKSTTRQPKAAASAAPSQAAAGETATSQSPRATYAIAMHGEPALPPQFTNFPYVDPNAPKGGLLRLGAIGSFDSLNGFIVKGVPAPGLREYVYDSLMTRSSAEPFTLYGLVAASIDVAPDHASVTFQLRSEARFSDGRPLTAADVEASHRMLRDKGLPFYRSYYRKVDTVDVLDPHTIRFTFGSDSDRELPLILGLMPILPASAANSATIEQTTLSPPIGSGPYVVDRLDTGRSLSYRRNRDYWARDLPTQRGRNNFDEVRYTFYRDNTTLFEAFKAGDIDVRVETEPSRWASSYNFPAVRDGRVVKREVAIGLPAGMSALTFNARRAPFKDQRVRQAFIQLLDADWINRNLYDGLYRRTASFFARSDLSAYGRPADDFERKLLAPFPGAVKPAVLDGTWRLPANIGTGRDRANLASASRLLTEAGYGLRAGRLVEVATGRPLAFEFLAASRAQERLMLAYAETLKRLGITMRIRQVDSAQYWSRLKTFDFDMAQWNWGASLSPGNEQLNRWSSQAADIEGTLNFAGVKNPAVDAMIDALLSAERRPDFESAVRALDRVLLSGDYVIPLFHAPVQWLAYWNRVAMPAQTSLSGVDFDTWWAVAEPAK